MLGPHQRVQATGLQIVQRGDGNGQIQRISGFMGALFMNPNDPQDRGGRVVMLNWGSELRCIISGSENA